MTEVVSQGNPYFHFTLRCPAKQGLEGYAAALNSRPMLRGFAGAKHLSMRIAHLSVQIFRKKPTQPASGQLRGRAVMRLALFVHEGVGCVIAEDFGLQARGLEILLHLVDLRGRWIIIRIGEMTLQWHAHF